MTETFVVCDLCGASAGSDQAPLTWSVSMDRGKVNRFCERCTRDHVRGIEGKLDPEYW